MRPGRLSLIVAFSLAYFLSYFFRSANAVIAGDLMRDLMLTAADLGLMTSLFYAGFAAIQLPLGMALDRFGPRLTTPALMLASVAGSLIFATAGDFRVLALGRLLIGVGFAGVLMGAFKAAGAWFAPMRVATMSSVVVGLGSLGALAAGTPLALVNQAAGWRMIFQVGAPVILFSALLVVIWTRSVPPGATLRPAQAATSGGFAQIFADLRFWRIAPLNFWLLGTMLAVQSLWGGPYLAHVAGLAPVSVGNLLLVLGIGVTAGYFTCGWLADRFGAAPAALVASSIFVVALAILALPGARPLALIALVYAVFGYTGAFNVVLLAHIRSIFPAHMSGRAITAVNLFGFGGSALIQWWMGLIINAFPASDGRYPPEAYAAAFAFALVCTLLAVLWYAPLAPGTRPQVVRMASK